MTIDKEKLREWLLGLVPDMQDVLVFGGLASVCWGLAQVYPPAAWIVGGAVLFWLGIKRG